MTDRYLDAALSNRTTQRKHQQPQHTSASGRIGVSDDGLVMKRGVLEKEGGMFKTWKHRYFLLHRGHLYWFLSEEHSHSGVTQAKGNIIISGSSLRALDSTEIPGKPYGIGITAPCTKQQLVLIAPTEDARIEWLEALLKAGAQEESGDETEKNSLTPRRGSTSSSTAASNSANIGQAITERMFSSSVIEGHLLKLGGVQKNKLQQRYFVLLGSSLIYFLTAGDQDSAKGSISLKGATVQQEDGLIQGHQHVFSITPKEKPSSSLFTTWFGEVLQRYVLIAKDQEELKHWMDSLEHEIQKCSQETTTQREEEDEHSDGEASDDEHSGSSNRRKNGKPSSHSNTPSLKESSPLAEASSAAFSMPVSPAVSSSSSSSFLPGDVYSHCYRYDLEDGSWKRRFCALDGSAKVLKVWRHKPTSATAAAAARPKLYDLQGARMKVNEAMRCSKVGYHPAVLSLGIPTSSTSSSSSTFLYLAPTSKSRFEEWYSYLLLTLGKARAETISAGRSSSDTATTPLKAPRAPNSSVKPTPAQSPITQSQLMDSMLSVLGDPEALDHFKHRCVELARGTMTPQAFFRSFWRMFGKAAGKRFWADLLTVLPKEEIRVELEKEMERNVHHFDPVGAEGDEAEGLPVTRRSRGSSINSTHHSGGPRTDSTPVTPVRATLNGAQESDWSVTPPADSSSNGTFIPPLPSFGPNDLHSSTPNFGSSSMGFPPAPVSSPSPDFDFESPTPLHPQPPPSNRAPSPVHAAERPTLSLRTPTSSSSSKSAAKTTPSFPRTPQPSSSSGAPSPSHPVSPAPPSSFDPLAAKDSLTSVVDGWFQRCESNILTLLCTLHEVLPNLVKEGQFIPFDDGYPDLKQVKQTLLKAFQVVHPDKQKSKSEATQLLCELVFQSLQRAWEQYEKAEKKRLKKAQTEG